MDYGDYVLFICLGFLKQMSFRDFFGARMPFCNRLAIPHPDVQR